MKKLLFIICYLIAKLVSSQNFDKQKYSYCLKVQPFNIPAYHFCFGIEKQLRPCKTISLMFGIIGVGNKPNDFYRLERASGNYIKFAYKKIISKPQKEFNGLYSSIEIGYARANEYARPQTVRNEVTQKNIDILGIMYHLGVDVIIKKRFLLNINYGIGASFDNRPLDHDYKYESNNYFQQKVTNTSRFAYTFGFSIGYLLLKK